MARLFLFLSPERAFLLQRAGGFDVGRRRRFKTLASEPRTSAGRERITEVARTLGRSRLDVVVDSGDELCHVRPLPARLTFACGTLVAFEREHLFGASPYVSVSWLGGRYSLASLRRKLRRSGPAAAGGADSAEAGFGLRLLGLTEEGDLQLWFSALEHAGCSLGAIGCGPLLWEQAVARIRPKGPVLLAIKAADARVRQLFFLDRRLLFVRSTEATAEALEETLRYLKGRFAACSGPGPGLAVFSIAGGESLAEHGELAVMAASRSTTETAGAERQAADPEFHCLSFEDLGRDWKAASGEAPLLAALFHYSSGRRTDYCPPLLAAKLLRVRRRRWLLAASGLLLAVASLSALIDGRKSLIHSERSGELAAAARSPAADCLRLQRQEGAPPERMHSLSQLFLQVRARRRNSPLAPLERLEQALACCPQLRLLELEWSAKKGLVAQGRIEDTDIERGSASFDRLLDRLSGGDWRVEVEQRPFSFGGSRSLRLRFSEDSALFNKGRASFEFRLFPRGS